MPTAHKEWYASLFLAINKVERKKDISTLHVSVAFSKFPRLGLPQKLQN